MKRLSMRDLIFYATIDLLQSSKIEDIGVNDIIKAAQVSKRTFYNYFKDKFDVCNQIYDNLLDTYCWEKDSKHQSLQNFFQRFSHLTELEDGKIRLFLQNTVYYQGQNNLSEYIVVRGIEDMKRIIRTNGREHLITEKNLYLMEFYLRGMIAMHLSLSEKDFAVFDLTQCLPKDLHDALTLNAD